MWKILLATDGSDSAAEASGFLARLPLPPDTVLHVLSVTAGWWLPLAPLGEAPLLEMETVLLAERERAREVVEREAARFRAKGLTVTTAVVEGAAAHQILAAAEGLAANLIVVGSRGLTGLEGLLLGSVARNVASHASCSVLIGQDPGEEISEVILATDGSEHGARALEAAARLPLPAGATVTVTMVLHPPGPGMTPLSDDRLVKLKALWDQRHATTETMLRAAAARLEGEGRQVRTEIREGDPATQIVDLAEGRGAALIIAGSRGISLIQGLLVGSVADRLLKQTPCSLLIAR